MIKPFVLILLLNVFNSFARVSEYKSELISPDEGISNNLIFSIYQDSRGFIWYGTMFGLIKYDGVNYTTFRYDPNDTTTISNDDVISICEDKAGYLWIGTYFGGLNRLDRSTGKFTRFIHNDADNTSLSNNTVWAIVCDKSGNMWFGTDGGGLDKFTGDSFIVYKNDSLNNSSLSNNMIFALAEGSDGIIWAGTGGGGLNKFDTKTETFTKYKRNLQDSLSISGNFIRSLYFDSAGYLWAGTMQRGLNKLDVSTGVFTGYVIPGENNINNRGSVFSILPLYNNSNEFWICSDNGLFSLEKSTGILTAHDIYNGEKNKNQSIVAACMDNSGVLWLSTYYEGLHKYYESYNKFTSYKYESGNSSGLSGKSVKCFYEDINDNIWIGTTGGLDKFDKNKNEFSNYLSNNSGDEKLSVNSVTGDSSGSLWLGTSNGLIYFDPVAKVQKKYLNDTSDDHSLSSDYVTKVLLTSDGTLWAGSNSGLNRLDKTTRKFQRFVHKPDNDNSLSEMTILSLFEDRENNVWAGTYAGLNMYDKISNRFIHYKKDLNNPASLSNNYIFSFYEDSGGNIWIGTGGGLNLFNRKDSAFKSYSEKNGLQNSVICGILPGINGNLWISTKKGLSEFNTKTSEFKNYTADDGLAANMFNEGAYLETKAGELMFGGIDGFTMFNPGNIIQRDYMPPVILTSLSVFSGRDIRTEDISALSEIKLSYDENIITFEFASLDYYSPKKNKYSYILEGFENDWKFPGHSSKAVYTNLDPGKYVFKVKGTNSDGLWSSKEAVITLIIKPPFWKTWWFFSLMFITVVAAGFILHNLRIRRKVNSTLMLEKAREAEREKIRMETSRDYHDELGHKLTRISIYTRRITKKLGVNSNGITGDLNGIIEVSDSLQSGAKDLIWSLNPDEDSLYDFAVRLKDFGNSIFENTGINFIMHGINDEMKKIKLNMKVKRHLIFIFKESMNNTLKYSGCTLAELTFFQKGSLLEISFDDNGIGFNTDQASAGYGLKNIHNRVKQIDANININSVPGSGTHIKFEIGV